MALVQSFSFGIILQDYPLDKMLKTKNMPDDYRSFRFSRVGMDGFSRYFAPAQSRWQVVRAVCELERLKVEPQCQQARQRLEQQLSGGSPRYSLLVY